MTRRAASALYHVASAILMAYESAQPGADGRRALYARPILDHRLSAQDPLRPEGDQWERAAADILLSDRSVPLAGTAELLER
jgi:acyl-CoA dehydrogenase